MNTLNKINRDFFILLAISMFGSNSMAQYKYDCIKTRGRTNEPYFAVSADKMNVLYVDIPNPVTIAASVAPEKLQISWGGAAAICTDRGKYNIFIPKSFEKKEITIMLYAKRKIGKPKFLGEVVFRVKYIPEPTMYISGKIIGGHHSKDTLLANPFVVVKMVSDFNYHLRWEVLSYNVSFIINDFQEPPITVKGAQFSEEVINKIKNAPSGTIIEFSDCEIQSMAGYFCIDVPVGIRIE